MWDDLCCSPSSATAGAFGVRYRTGLPHCRVSGGCGHSGASSSHTSSGNTGDDPTHALPEGLLDPVGVWDSVDWDHSLGHGHSTDLGVVVAEASEDGGQDMSGLVWSPGVTNLHNKEGRLAFSSVKVASVRI